MNTKSFTLTILPDKAERQKPSSKGAKRAAFQPQISWKNKEGQPTTYAKVIRENIDRIMSMTIGERLQELIDLLEKQGSKTDKKLAKQLRGIKTKTETMEDDWGLGGVSDIMSFNVNVFVEEMLPRYIRAMLYQLTVEGLLTTQTFIRYQKHMRLAAGLKEKMSAETDDFIVQLHSRLIDAPRRKRSQVTPGGSTSPLKKYAHALCFHYERLRVVWRHAKKTYRLHGGGLKGRETVKRSFQYFNPFNEGTLGAQHAKPEQFGLPDMLIAKLEPAREDAKEFDSSPEHLAYQHAAFLCGFQIDEYSVKQLKRVVSEHKKMLGSEYYDNLFTKEEIEQIERTLQTLRDSQ